MPKDGYDPFRSLGRSRLHATGPTEIRGTRCTLGLLVILVGSTRYPASGRGLREANHIGRLKMPILLWLLGIPIPIIILLLLLWH